MRAKNVFGITGWKNSGKTTLIVALVEDFTRRSLRVSTIKHARRGRWYRGRSCDSHFACAISTGPHHFTQNQVVESVFGPAWPLFWVFSVMGAGLFWAFATELFGDRPRLEAIRFAPAAPPLALGIAKLLTTGTTAGASLFAQHLVGAAFMVHVLFVIWRGWRNDLVESRRRLRGPILAAGGVYAVAVLSVQITEIFVGSAAFLSPLAAAVLVALGLAGLGALLQAEPELFAVAGRPRPVAVAASGARRSNGGGRRRECRVVL